jgi:hypothetical protein
VPVSGWPGTPIWTSIRAAVCRQQTLARAHLQSTKRPRWHRGDKDVTASIAHKADLTTVLEKKNHNLMHVTD